MGMEVKKNNLGFGVRSWRYAAIINNRTIEKLFEEPGKSDNFSDDPYQETSPDNILSYLNMKSTKSA
jgi:peroxiredoxin